MEAAFDMGQNPFAAEAPKPKFNVNEFIRNYQKSTVSIAMDKGAKIVDALGSMAANIVKRFLEYARIAVEVAVSKFLVELCAMIIVGVGSMAQAKGHRPIDITTSGVFYTPAGAAATAGAVPQQPVQQQQPLWSNSPFDQGWGGNNSRAGVW